MNLPQIDAYRELFVNDTPMIDVRAPVEFSQGAFPNAENLPLLGDEERHKIGIRYKEAGREKAIELGSDLVQGDIQRERVDHWRDFAARHPEGALYCFRGGLRSKISQQWLYDRTGIVYPRIEGGYKALRRFLLQELETVASHFQASVLGGRTGVGKTLLLKQLYQKIDLENIYHHRGSAFGKHVRPQPSQIDIENRLAIALLKQRNNKVDKIVLEDEAPNIGPRQVPAGIFQLMQSSPLILLEASLDERVDNVFDEYITESLNEYQELLGQGRGFDTWAGNLTEALENIKRRLGGERYKVLSTIMSDALNEQRQNNNAEQHKIWIRSLLQDYYDPMYDYQLEKKMERVVFHGEHEGLLNYLHQHLL